MSRICLGLMRIAHLSVDEVENLLKESLALGINKIDIADIYGDKVCETLLGKVFKKNPDLRKQVYLQSKIGIQKWTCGYDLSYDYIIEAVKGCLERLQTTYLDSLLLHRVDIFMDNEEVSKAIKYLQENGLIKDFGVSNFNTSEIKYLQKKLETKIKYNQVQLGLGNTTMIDQTMFTNVPQPLCNREPDDLFFFLKSEEIAIQCWSPYQFGFFQGSIFDSLKYPQINQVLEKYADKYQTSKCAIATAFLLKLDKNLVVITGSTEIKHIKESLDGESINLSKEDWYRIYQETGHLLP